MGKIVAFEWLSVDGVFDADYMEEWFFPYDSLARRELIRDTYRQADAFLMGRTTYEMLAPYWSQLPDDHEDGIAGVLTHIPKFIASSGTGMADWGETTILGKSVEAEVEKLKSRVGTTMIIGSSKFAASLAKADLIDEYILLIQPHLMGVGRHFFGREMSAALELDEIKPLDQGMVLARYRVKR